MKKFLCFTMGVFLSICGLQAQLIPSDPDDNCVYFLDANDSVQANLYPQLHPQRIYINFNDASLEPTKKYALEYEIHKNGHIMTDFELLDDFTEYTRDDCAQTFAMRVTRDLYIAQNFIHSTGRYPNGNQNACANASNLNFNFVYGSYLRAEKAQFRLILGWRSDKDYSQDSYMLVIRLVTMKNGRNQNLNYSHPTAFPNGTPIGGYDALYEGDTIARDTITTIKYLDYTIQDTVCFNDIIGHKMGRTTIDQAYLDNHTNNNASTPFAYFINDTIVFGEHGCNGRIDSIGPVVFHVWPDLSVAYGGSGSGELTQICPESTKGKISLLISNAVKPYTVTAYRSDTRDGAYDQQYGSSRVSSDDNYIFDSLCIGFYRFEITDITGCTIVTDTCQEVSDTTLAQTWAFTQGTPRPKEPTCHYDGLGDYGDDGKIIFHSNEYHYGRPVFTLTATDTLIPGDTVVATYTYPNDAGAIVEHTFLNLIPGTYHLSGEDRRGCKTDTVEVIINNPDIPTTYDTIYCCASEVSNGIEYLNTDTIFTSVGSKEVHLISGKGCDSIVIVLLDTFPNPTVTFTPDNGKVCADADITITTEDRMTNYVWTDNGTVIAGANANSITQNWSETGKRTISVNYTETHTTKYGDVTCRAIKDTTTTITVNARPNDTITTQVNGIDSSMNIIACAGDTVTLAAYNEPTYAYAWVKVGTIDTVGREQTLVFNDITATEAGQYALILTDTSAANATNCAATSDTVTIEVNTPDVKLGQMDDYTICNMDGTVKDTLKVIVNSHSGDLSYKWTCNNSSTFDNDESEKPEVTMSDTTEFYVTVTATIGACTKNDHDIVKVNVNTPNIELGEMQDQTICESNPTTAQLAVFVKESTGTLLYKWEDNNGASYAPTDTVANPTVTVTDTTTFIVTVTSDLRFATDATCFKTAKETVTVNVNSPAIDIHTNAMLDTIICNGDTIQLYPNVTSYHGTLTYAWNTNATTDTISVNPTVTTRYSVIVTSTIGEGAYTCQKFDYDTVDVKVLSPRITLGDTITAPNSICKGSTVALTIWWLEGMTTADTVTYEWNTSDITADITSTPDTTTTYIAAATAHLYDTLYKNGDIIATAHCPATAADTVTVIVYDPRLTLKPIEGPTNHTICLGDTATLVVTPDTVHSNFATVTYLWNTNETSDTLKVAPTTGAEYSVIATAHLGGCDKQATGSYTISINAPEITMNEISGPTAICLGESADLTASVATSTGTVTYDWTPLATLTFPTAPTNNIVTITPVVADTTDLTIVGTALVNTNDVECRAYDTVTFRLIANDTVKFTANRLTDTVCAGEPEINIVAFSAENATISHTDLPAGLTFVNDTLSGIPTEPGIDTIVFTATSIYTTNCTAKTLTYIVTVNDPVGLATDDDTTFTLCVGETVNIGFDVNNGTIASTDVTGLPAGLTFANDTITGTLTTAGVYHYSITATSDKTPACTQKTITGTITVNDTVELTGTADTTQAICLGEAINNIVLTKAHSTLEIVWTGSSHDGLTFANDTISGTPTTAGTIRYTITATSDNDCTPKTITGTITVNDTVQLTGTVDTTQIICLGNAITDIQIGHENCTMAISWTNGDPGLSFDALDGTISGTPNTYGVFTYAVNTTSDHGCSEKSVTGTITVNDTVQLAFVSGVNGYDTVCLGNAITNISVDSANSTLSIEWDSHDGLTFADGTISGTPTAAGIINYTITATSDKTPACTEKSLSGAIVVNDTVKLAFIGTEGKDTVCLGNAIENIVLDTANCTLTFTPELSRGLSYDAATHSITGVPDTAMVFNYTITATSNQTPACTEKTLNVTIVVNDTTIADIVSSRPAINDTVFICASPSEINDTLTFTATTGMENYTWNVNGGTIISGDATESIKVQWATEGTKAVSVAYTSPANGCRGTSKSVTVQVVPQPDFTISGSESDNRICADATDTISVAPTNSNSVFTWNPTTYLTAINDTAKVLENANPGEYTYTVTSDITISEYSLSCRVSHDLTIIVDTLPTVVVTHSNPTCYGYTNGNITATATGAAPFTYTWDNGMNNAFNNFIGAGVYNVIVKDIHGCTVSATDTVKQPDQLIAEFTNLLDVACHAETTGEFAIEVSGGTQFINNQYQYWLDSISADATDTVHLIGYTVDALNNDLIFDVTGHTFKELGAGIYQVTIGDKNGCRISVTDTIKEPTESLSLTLATMDILCNGGNSGYIHLTVAGGTPDYTGGTPDYTYEWNPNVYADANADNLTIGTYTVTVTDHNECQIDTTVTLIEPTALVATIDSTHNISCNDGNDGYIRVGVTGGTYEYHYEWITDVAGFTTSDDSIRNDLKAGEYKIVVTDSHNCTDTVKFTLTQPDALTVTAIDSVNIKCHDNNDGSIRLTVNGGTRDYTYAWTGPNGDLSVTDSVATDLVAGQYNIRVTDANGCTLDTVVTLTQPDELTLNYNMIAHITCHGANNGRLQLDTVNIGGVQPHTYSWDGGVYSGTNTVIDTTLTPGEHIITVVDSNNCRDTLRVTIEEPDQLTINHTAHNLSCFESQDGRIEIGVTGGRGEYTYIWEDLSANQNRTNLTAGTYYLMVHDTNECKAYDTVTLIQPEYFKVTLAGTDEICADGNTTFTATIDGAAGTDGYTYTYQWYKDGAELTDSVNTSIHNITAAGNYWMIAKQSVSAWGTVECEQADTITLTVYDLPNVTISATADSICYAKNATITAAGATDYAWEKIGEWNSNDIDPTNEASFIFNGNSTGIYVAKVTGTAYNGTNLVACSNTAYDTITVLALPVVAITSGPQDTVCAFSTLTLEATGATSYEWSGDGVTGTNAQAEFTMTAAGTYPVTVEGTDDFGCVNTAEDIITVNELPVADIKVYVNDVLDENEVELCAEGNVRIEATPNSGYSYAWYHEGTQIADSVAYHLTLNEVATTDNGKYVVVVTDNVTGCEKASDTVYVKVNVLPEVELTEIYGADTICADSNFHFLVTTNATFIEWEYNGTPMTNTETTYTTNEGGEYVVIVTDGNECQNTDTLKVVSNALPTFDITTNRVDNTICQNDTITLTGNDGTDYHYIWVYDTDTIGADNRECKHVCSAAGTHTVSLTVTDEQVPNACSATKTTNVIVNALPNVTVADTTSICLHGVQAIAANGANTYEWNALDDLQGNILEDHGSSVDAHGNTPGTYAIEVTGTDANFCSAKDTAIMIVRDLPTTGLTLANDTICMNATTGFKVNETYVSYTWTSTLDNSLNTTTGDTVTFTGVNSGDYTVTVMVVDANGCQNSATANVLVNALPNVTLTSTPNPKCQNDTITFTTEADMTNYTWTYTTTNTTVIEDGSEGTLRVIWSDYGIKNIKVNYTDANGCRAATPRELNDTINGLPNIVIAPGDFDTICLGSVDTIFVTGGTSYVWNTTETNDTILVSPAATTTYSVIGTDDIGCKNYDTLHVIVNDTVKFTLANRNQEICLGEPITNIVFDTANCTLNLADLNLSHGFSVLGDSIIGVPDTAMTFSYSIIATSTATPACLAKYNNFTIYVYDTTKLTVTHYDQTKCLGQPIDTIHVDTANCTLSFNGMPTQLYFDEATMNITGTITQAGTYTFDVIATSNTTTCTGYSKTQTVNIVINDTIKLDADLTTQTICLGDTITDIVLDTANCTLAFTPELPQGISYNAARHSLVGAPEAAGEYSFTITASNDLDCNDTKTLDINITVNDTAKIELLSGLDADNAQRFCFGNAIEPIVFQTTNVDTAILTLTPDLDGLTLTKTNDTVTITGTPAQAGAYTFSVTVSNDNECGTKAYTGTITVDTLPVVAITSRQADNRICPDGQQQDTLNATVNSGWTYEWSTTETTDSVIVMPVGDSTFIVTVTDGIGCQGSDTITLGVHTLPQITFTGDPGFDTICLGTTTAITAEVVCDGTPVYEWANGVGADATVNVTPVADSVFTVTVYDGNGCYNTASDTVVVKTLPVAEITHNGLNDTICQNDTITLSVSDAYQTYVWKDGENTIGDDANTCIFVMGTDYAADSIHIISVAITDAVNCTSRDTVEIRVKPTPRLLAAHNRVRCFGETNAYINLTVENNTDIESYLWSNDSITQNISSLGAGEYTVVVTANNGCANTLTDTILQPELLTAVIDTNNSALQHCKGSDTIIVISAGGTPDYHYSWQHIWANDTVTVGADSDTLSIQDLALGDHYYNVTVTDDSNCVANLEAPWIVSSSRNEVYREINLMPGETYIHDTIVYTDQDDGAVFEDVVVFADDCDSAYIYTIHVYDLPFHFAQDPLIVQHSSYKREYIYTPTPLGDTIWTAPGVDNMFYAYVMTDENTWDALRVDMRYNVLFNDEPIDNADYDYYIDNLKFTSYHEHDELFYGHSIDSARGEVPATTFLYQTPSNSTAYYYDYFNFPGFNKIPQKIEFNFNEPGTYTIKLHVESRTGGTAGQYWGIYNPYVVQRQFGPIWGGRNDNPTRRDTITARYMTVIVDEQNANSNPVISSIEDYTTTNAEPVITTYPNPARDMLYLNIKGMEGQTFITITDAAGKVVANYNENLLNSETTLNYSVAKFAQGVYFLNIHNDDNVITKKFIVTK